MLYQEEKFFVTKADSRIQIQTMKKFYWKSGIGLNARSSEERFFESTPRDRGFQENGPGFGENLDDKRAATVRGVSGALEAGMTLYEPKFSYPLKSG